jgi:hypothetical protein
MRISMTDLAAKVASQAARIPSMYGRVDLSITPERFAAEPNAQTELDPQFAARRPELLADEEQAARIKGHTMLGDLVVDAYAALMPKYGFHGLTKMLEQACDHGPEQVPSAPPELFRFIQEMERLPEWTRN